MYYEVDEVSTEARTGMTYVLVRFWPSEKAAKAGEPPELVNDFIMQLRAEANDPVFNEMGPVQRKDGVFVPPEALTERDRQVGFAVRQHEYDVQQIIRQNIESFAQRAEAKGLKGSRAGSFERVQSDPHGVLARVDVATLKGDTAVRGQRQ